MGFDIFWVKFGSVVDWDRGIASSSSICFYFSFAKGSAAHCNPSWKNSVQAKVHLDVCPPVTRNLELLA